MSNQMITSTLLADLSTDEQQFLSGGQCFKECMKEKDDCWEWRNTCKNFKKCMKEKDCWEWRNTCKNRCD